LQEVREERVGQYRDLLGYLVVGDDLVHRA